MDNHNQAPLQTTPYKNALHPHYTVQDILNKANHHWPHILERLGINSSYLKNKHGPCPVCKGKDRFRFDDKEGRGTFFCNVCRSGDGITLLRLYHGWDFPEALNKVAEIIDGYWQQSQDSVRRKKPEHISQPLARVMKAKFPSFEGKESEKRRKALATIWQQAKRVTADDPVDCYLKARKIVLNEFPQVLRYHPCLPYYDDERVLTGYFPAMLALVTDRNNEGVSLHRTYLGNGCKANVSKPKKLMPAIVPGASAGSVIKLYEPADGILAIAEGVETALAFTIGTQLPTWAAISAGGMEKVTLPQNVREVLIVVDNDRSGRGQQAASILTKRLLNEGRAVKRIIPPHVGNDFADMLMGGDQ